MPVDSTYPSVQCRKDIEDHYYMIYPDGTHAERCNCGEVVVLNGIHDLERWIERLEKEPQDNE